MSSEILRLIPSTEYCMQYLRCRGYARSDNVMIRDEDIMYIIKKMLNIWFNE